MTLSALIRKRENATATLATPATHKGARAGTVANVASVAVAKAPAATPKPEAQSGSVANVASVAVANQLFPEEEAPIRAWLAHIEETDPATIADVLEQCQNDAQTRAYCLEQARQIPPPPEPDYTATCGACRHFQRIDHPNLGHCAQGEPEAPAGLWDTDRRWCRSFKQAPDKQEDSRP
ncbi:hypothetical protein SAMN02745117_02730 [Lampropedia hyalina DSM 16112]|jgi:hypothetical protein|uniref:Uncharacterized protein n=1 Tax=Lampropedia hyalina DSM 16112 TaxID=1122156 RepID=A0A1M5F3L8_9BURK|nr:hypothetical protein SAMN02745117_02730 [Lampropedia hyalina DSM 16112]